MLSAGVGRVFLDKLGLTSRPYVGLGPVRTPDEENCSGYFFCLFVLDFEFCFRHS